jgi:hypothetical protein
LSLGAKTLVTLALFGGALFAAWSQGRLRSDYLAQLDPWAMFTIAAFAVLVASALAGYLGLDGPSKYWVGPRSSHRQSRQLEVPPVLRRCVYIATFALFGLATLDNRAVSMLLEFPGELAQSSSEYCPEEEPPDPDDPSKLGCELVLRAVQLGYSTELGECGEDKEEAPEQICDLRQADEPYLHYSWRLLASNASKMADSSSGSALAAEVEDLKNRWERMGALLGAQVDPIVGAPRASHHLFTNLPAPPATALAGRPGMNCLARFATMPHLLPPADDDKAASRALEHVLGQLLFNPAHKPIVALCSDFAVHWGAPPDTCARLAADAPGVLAELDALEPVRELVLRRAQRQEIYELSRLGTAELDTSAMAGAGAAPPSGIGVGGAGLGTASPGGERNGEATGPGATDAVNATDEGGGSATPAAGGDGPAIPGGGPAIPGGGLAIPGGGLAIPGDSLDGLAIAGDDPDGLAVPGANPSLPGESASTAAGTGEGASQVAGIGGVSSADGASAGGSGAGDGAASTAASAGAATPGDADAEHKGVTVTPPPPLQRVVSFQCLNVSPDGTGAVATHELTLDGQTFVARELRVRRITGDVRGELDLFGLVAALFAPAPAPDPTAQINTGGDPEQTAALLSRPGYLLTKLEFLRDADLFAGHQWLDRRADLLEVYPYHLHLARFIAAFRLRYTGDRGRL